MAFWTRALGSPGSVVPNSNGPEAIHEGEVGGLEYDPGPPVEQRALTFPAPSAWSGWGKGWDTPNWQIDSQINKLVDVAWQCLDMQSNVVSAMPVYLLNKGRIKQGPAWMDNPDPMIYSSWQEFAKQFFWDYQMGEVFVLSMAEGADGYPSKFRVIPPYMIKVELRNGVREYAFGSIDVTDKILHIRYSGTTTEARGRGPLDVADLKMTQIKLLQRYANSMAETGGVPLYWLGVERRLQKSEATDILDQWIETRAKYVGQPAILGSGATLNQARTMDAKEMGLLEISQFSESRIAGLLGVPPFLVGLAGASGSLTYSNIADLFDYHDRSSLRPKTRTLMESLSAWALPRGSTAELNRDDYTRLPFDKRVATYKQLMEMGVFNAEDVKIRERFFGADAAQALTGGLD